MKRLDRATFKGNNSQIPTNAIVDLLARDGNACWVRYSNRHVSCHISDLKLFSRARANLNDEQRLAMLEDYKSGVLLKTIAAKYDVSMSYPVRLAQRHGIKGRNG